MSSSQVFIFDICAMGASAFENGLKDILESYQIVKVIGFFCFLRKI